MKNYEDDEILTTKDGSYEKDEIEKLTDKYKKKGDDDAVMKKRDTKRT